MPRHRSNHHYHQQHPATSSGDSAQTNVAIITPDTSTATTPRVELRRVVTMPASVSSPPSADAIAISPAASTTLYMSKSDLGPVQRSGHKLDAFGFIVNMDSQGNVVPVDYDDNDDDDVDDSSDEADFPGGSGQTHSPIPTFAQAQLQERREKKWNGMMQSWNSYYTGRRRKKLVQRLRKGIPLKQRGQVWSLLCNVKEKMEKNPGLYDRLVTGAVRGNIGNGNNSSALKHTKSFKSIQDTIERDIHRTFPRHSMFFDDHDDDTVIPNNKGLCGTTEISDMIKELEFNENGNAAASSNNTSPDAVSVETALRGRGGQASLRRVLKAYSLYDREIGYCQGMNFIAGMFLTLASTEEEAFWMLTSAMHDKPMQMRGLFGEGMSETHMVLHVAEKLIHQFLPKLAKHLDREHVHVTMYATQWLLTQYTSSFRFDLVTRVWDCFLAEGWKITYRVMLSLLTQWQSALLKMTFEEILVFFRELPDRVEGAAVVDAAVKIPLRRKHVLKFENEWRAQQQQRQRNA